MSQRRVGAVTRVLVAGAVVCAFVLVPSRSELARAAANGGTAIAAVTVPEVPADLSKPHLTYSGASITLEGVARGGADQYMWDFGDGSSPTAWTAIGDPNNLGVGHSYTGSVGQMFTATLSVRDSSQPAVVASASYPVEIEAGADPSDPAQAKVRAAMALDASLWYLHLNETRLIGAGGAPAYGQPLGVWKGNDSQKDTCAATVAFERGGSLMGGDANSDPYVDDVQRGLNSTFADAVTVPISQGGRDGNPDVNGNGIAIRLGDDSTFTDGLCALAVASSGASDSLAQTGPTNVYGRSYAAIGQDLADWFSWGQTFGCAAGQGCLQSGGWYYYANGPYGVGSTNPWPILALGALNSFGETVPVFVRNRIPDFVNYIHNTVTASTDYGGYGYEGPTDFVSVAETSGGILAHLLVGDSVNYPDVRHAIAYMYRHWGDPAATDSLGLWHVNLGDSFTMFLTAEALTEAAPSVGLTQITDFNATDLPSFDGAYTQAGQTQTGYGNFLIAHQAADGSLPDTNNPAPGSNGCGDIGADGGFPCDIFASTAFDSVVLEDMPRATGDSVVAANVGGPYTGVAGVPVQLDGSGSTGSGLSYAWDFHNNGLFADATGPKPTVTFSVPGSYPIALRVTDSAGTQSADSTTVTISAPPPTADPGGPYTGTAGSTISLDGTASSDPSGLPLEYAWDLQGNGLYTDSTAAKPNFTIAAAVSAGTVYTICLKVSNGASVSKPACTTVTVVPPEQPPTCLIVAPNEVLSNTGTTMTFTVDGSNSSDPNGKALTYSWTTDSGPSFADPNAAITTQSRDMAHAGASVSWTDTLAISNGSLTSTCTKTITVVDNQPPTFTTTPADVTFEADTNTTAKVQAWLTDVAASDPAAPLSLPVTINDDFVPNSGSGGVGVGNTVKVTWTAVNPDDATATAQTSATVTVVDTTPPTLTLPSDKTGEATGPGGRAVSFTASATDFVSGNIPVTCSPPSGSSFSVGTTTVACTATDGAGNTATGTFTVTTTDTTPPTLSLPSDRQVVAPNATGATVNFTATATDLVDGSVPVVCSPASGSTFPVGTTTVNCSANDADGNTATGSFKVTVLYDPTPPVITPTVAGTLGNNGWYRSDVSLSWAVNDPESTISASSGCESATRTTDTDSNGVTYTCTATSLGGTATRSVTIKRDIAPPALTCGNADNSWHPLNATIGCTAADPASGLAMSTDASFSLTTSVAAGSETAGASTDSRLVCDVAGNCATAGPIGGNKVDRKPPTITCNAASFTLNQTPATITAVATDGGSGPASQNLAVAADTSSTGLKSVSFSASDAVGNLASQSCSYAVGYAFGGFMSPLPKSTLQKSGSTIPVKFTLTDASGHPLLAAMAAALAAANDVEATLAGPGISPQTALCSWNSFALYFQCNIKTPAGVKTGTPNPYTITAWENLGSGFTAAPPVGGAVNPETVYFK